MKLKTLSAAAGLLVLTMIFLALPGRAHADVNNFTVNSFISDESLSRADPQGELDIIENVTVTFNSYNHGILRAIPDSYKHHSLQLKVKSVMLDGQHPVQYTTYGSNGNTVLKIGNPDHTITGTHIYRIEYTVHNVISFYKDHDELYWDINGDQWQQQFNHVVVLLHLPDGLKQDRQPVCYAGGYGATARDCTVSNVGPQTVEAQAGPLKPRHTLTLVAGFKPGYFHPSRWYETIGEYGQQIAAVVLPVLLLGGSSFLYWWREGRDPKGSGVIVPQYDPPDGLKPLQVDGLVDFTAGTTGITATIINLAIRGYIRIIETKQNKRLRKDTVSYSLQLLNTDFSALGPDEKILMKALFDVPMKDEIVDVSAQKNKLYKTVDVIQKNVKQELKDQGYLRNNRSVSALKDKTKLLKTLIYVALFIWLYHWVGTSIIIGLVAGIVIAIAFLAALEARTAKGVAAKEHAQGLKMYLEVAEKDRLEKLQGPNAAYAPKTAEPKKTVELFEKLLPYAMVLGVEKQWAGQFESLYTTPPGWYSGNWTTFNAAYLATSLNSGIGSAVSGAFSAPSSSGSSGFGGGFAGGGGGGGGGGGW